MGISEGKKNRELAEKLQKLSLKQQRELEERLQNIQSEVARQTAMYEAVVRTRTATVGLDRCGGHDAVVSSLVG